jgi:pilus assembly protein CpaC
MTVSQPARCLTAFLVLLFFTFPALADRAHPGEAMPTSVTLEVGRGRVVRFASPVASIFVADEKVADIKAVARGVVYLQGRSIGATNVIALDARQRTIGEIGVTIVPEEAGDGSGGGHISVTGGRLVGEGEMHDAKEALNFNAMLRASSKSPPLNLSTYAGATQVNTRALCRGCAR